MVLTTRTPSKPLFPPPSPQKFHAPSIPTPKMVPTFTPSPQRVSTRTPTPKKPAPTPTPHTTPEGATFVPTPVNTPTPTPTPTPKGATPTPTPVITPTPTPTPTPKGSRRSHTLECLQNLGYPHQVLDAIAERHQSGSKPGQRKDGRKIGLCVEGGGMRGVISAAMMVELLPYKDCFDVVYGSSAGAINSTYFLSGQKSGLNIYIEEACDNQFVDLMRYFSDKPVMNLDFILNDLMSKVKPLDYDAVLESPIPLKIIASCVHSLQSKVLETPKTKDELLGCLRASANVPIIAGDQPVNVQGRSYVDGAVFEPIPYISAVQEGCTHVLVLCTSPPPVDKTVITQLLEKALQKAIKKYLLNSEFMDVLWEAAFEWEKNIGETNETLLFKQLDKSNEMQNQQGGVNDLQDKLSNAFVLPVYPTKENTNFMPTCIDQQLLNIGLLDGQKVMQQVLQTHPQLQ